MRKLNNLTITLLMLAFNQRANGAGLAPQVKVPIILEPISEVSVATDYMYLGNLASCRGLERMCRELASVLVGKSPKPREMKTIQAKRLAELAELEMPHLNIKVKKDILIRVKASFQELDLDHLRAALNQELGQNLVDKTIGVELMEIRYPNNTLVRPGVISWRFPDLSSYLKDITNRKSLLTIRKKICAKASIYFAGSTSHQDICVTPHFKIKYWAPVAIKNLRPGMIMKQEYFEMGWVFGDKGFARSFEDLVGKKLKKRVVEGKPIKMRYVEVPVLVRRGQQVNVLINSGGLVIRDRARVMNPGGLGDDVSVRLNSSKKIARAKVMNSKEVEIIR